MGKCNLVANSVALAVCRHSLLAFWGAVGGFWADWNLARPPLLGFWRICSCVMSVIQVFKNVLGKTLSPIMAWRPSYEHLVVRC